MQMSGDFAAMIAPILLGAISDAGGFRPAFLVATVLMAVIVAITLRIPETRNSVHRLSDLESGRADEA
jgi:MFS family permease